MTRPPAVEDCGCHGGVHLRCAESIGRYEADRVIAQIEAEEAIQTVDGFNERFGTSLSFRDWYTICDWFNDDELVHAAMVRAGWY